MTLALSFACHTRKFLIVAPVSLLTLLMPCIVCFATSVFAIFSATSSPAWLTSITSWRLGSLFGLLALVACERVVPDLAAPPLAATNAHDCVDGGDAKKVLSCV